MNEITPCLWFDTEGEDAAKLLHVRVPELEDPRRRALRRGRAAARGNGDDRELRAGRQEFVALNGGPEFTFNEAISFQVSCEDQDEVDLYWSKLSEGGEEGPCGWLKDRFGLSWQIVPTALPELLGDPDREKAQRVMAAMLRMKKIEIDELERAAA